MKLSQTMLFNDEFYMVIHENIIEAHIFLVIIHPLGSTIKSIILPILLSYMVSKLKLGLFFSCPPSIST
jgi:hypothetical protein